MYRYVISTACVEEHLADTKPGRSALGSHQMETGGLSVLRAPYQIERSPAKEHVLLMTLKGAGTLELNGTRHTLTPNTICLLPAGLTYRYWTKRSWTKAWFHLLPVERWSMLAREFFLRPGSGWADLRAVMRLFLNERSRGRADSLPILDSLAKTMAGLIEREISAQANVFHPEQLQRVEAAREKLYREPGYPWSVPSMAAEFGFSARSLQALVKKLYGCGVMEMVTKARLEKAASLLVTTDLKLEAIATVVGYQNSFAFSRVFKRHMGTNPREYRLKARTRRD